MSKMPEQIVKPFCNFCIRQFWSIGLEVKSDWRDDHSVRVDMINHAVGAALSHLSLNPDANLKRLAFVLGIWSPAFGFASISSNARVMSALKVRNFFNALLSSELNAGNDRSIRNKLNLFSPVMDSDIRPANGGGGLIQSRRGFLAGANFPRL